MSEPKDLPTLEERIDGLSDALGKVVAELARLSAGVETMAVNVDGLATAGLTSLGAQQQIAAALQGMTRAVEKLAPPGKDGDDWGPGANR